MDKNARRFCCFETRQDTTGADDDAIPNRLASALEQNGVPFQMLVNSIDRDASADFNSCDLYPADVVPARGFQYEFLTTDPHFQRARQIAAEILSNPESGLNPR